MNKPTVFVSSTIRDMGDLRDKVRDLLTDQLGYTILLSENEGSRPKTPLAQCRKWSKECDIFIAILGQSYGWIIPNKGISVCEFEFNEAYKDNPEKILLYVSGKAKEERQKKFAKRISDFNEGYFRRATFNNKSALLDGIRDDLANYFKETLDVVHSKKLTIRNRITPSKEDYAISNRSDRIGSMMADAIELATQLGFSQVKYDKPLFWSAIKKIKRRSVLFTFVTIPDNLDSDWMREINLRSPFSRFDQIYTTYPNRFTIIFVHGTANISSLERLTRYFSGTCFKVEPGLYFGADLTTDKKSQGIMSLENRLVLPRVKNRQIMSTILSDALQWINEEYDRINFKSNYQKRKSVTIKKWKR